MAAAYIRRKGNNLYDSSVNKTRTTSINGSQLSSRPDRSNDDVLCFGASRNLQQWLERAKKRNDWLWSGKSHILHCLFRFKLTLRSRLVLGCCET